MKFSGSSVLAVAISSLLAACVTGPQAPTVSISGIAAYQSPLASADITVCDAAGVKKTAKADTSGAFSVDASDLTAPILIAAANGPVAPINGSISFAALLPNLQQGNNVANVNALTDKISSEVAIHDLKLKGSVQLIEACKPAGVTAATIEAQTAALRPLVAAAYQAAGVTDTAFDPVKTAPDTVLIQIYHNRDGFSDTRSDSWRATTIYDRNLQEIDGKNVPLDPNLKPWLSYARRIFVAGDSTASNYPLEVAPRMGWGQALSRLVKDPTKVKVVNAAQSGRASRSFVEEGWFKLIEDNIQPGDYLLVQFGHNDEKCAAKDANDVLHRCTYPGKVANITAKGISADMAFQTSLERYVVMARSKGAIPVLVTPMTRIVQDKNIKDYEEGLFPIKSTTHTGPSTSAIPGGDYSQTVRDTAKANNVALVDLDVKSIAFMNSIGNGTGGAEAKGGWRDYHLAVSDFTQYPYYKDPKTTGHYKKADRTHFQEKGAVKMASFVVEGIKQDPALADLIQLFK